MATAANRRQEAWHTTCILDFCSLVARSDTRFQARQSVATKDREIGVSVTKCGMPERGSAVGCTILMALALTAARADDKTYVMKITLPTINEGQHLFAKNYAAAVERDSGGRIKAEVYPASQ